MGSAKGLATGSAVVSGTIGFSSGSISSFILETLLGEGIVHPLDRFADKVVDHEEVGAESEHRCQHYARRSAHLLPRRPGNQLHLVLQFFEIVLHPRRPSADSLRHAVCFAHRNSLYWNLGPLARQRAKSAGSGGRGGGIRTPTRGFGDRWSAVKPTPLLQTPVYPVEAHCG